MKTRHTSERTDLCLSTNDKLVIRPKYQFVLSLFTCFSKKHLSSNMYLVLIRKNYPKVFWKTYFTKE